MRADGLFAHRSDAACLHLHKRASSTALSPRSPRCRPPRTEPRKSGNSTTTTNASTTGTRPAASRRTRTPGPAAEPIFEMHNLTADPEKRHNSANDAPRHDQPAPDDPRLRARHEAARPRAPESGGLIACASSPESLIGASDVRAHRTGLQICARGPIQNVTPERRPDARANAHISAHLCSW